MYIYKEGNYEDNLTIHENTPNNHIDHNGSAITPKSFSSGSRFLKKMSYKEEDNAFSLN